jgi:hypothetical protein
MLSAAGLYEQGPCRRSSIRRKPGMTAIAAKRAFSEGNRAGLQAMS